LTNCATATPKPLPVLFRARLWMTRCTSARTFGDGVCLKRLAGCFRDEA